MCYTQICPRFECRDEHTIHTCVYCVLTLNAGTGRGVCVCVCVMCIKSCGGHGRSVERNVQVLQDPDVARSDRCKKTSR